MIAMHMPTMPTFHPASVLPVCLTSGFLTFSALGTPRQGAPARSLANEDKENVVPKTDLLEEGWKLWVDGDNRFSTFEKIAETYRKNTRVSPTPVPVHPLQKESMARTENDEVPLKVPKEAIWPEDDAELCAPIPVLAVPTPIPITSPEPTALPNEPITPSLSLPRIVHPVHPRDRPQLRQGVLIREALRAHGSAVPDMAPEDLATFLPRPLSLTPPTAVTPAPRRERRRVGTRGRASRRRSTIPAPKQDGELVWLQRGIFLPSPRLEEGPSRIPRPIWQSFVDLLDYF